VRFVFFLSDPCSPLLGFRCDVSTVLAQPAAAGMEGSRQGDGRPTTLATAEKETRGPDQGARPARPAAVPRRLLHLRQSRNRSSTTSTRRRRCCSMPPRRGLRAGDAADRRRLRRGQGRAPKRAPSMPTSGSSSPNTGMHRWRPQSVDQIVRELKPDEDRKRRRRKPWPTPFKTKMIALRGWRCSRRCSP